jgi:hypothetical protein
MSPRLTFEGLVKKLATGTIVPLGENEWVGVAEHFPLVDDIDTFMSGRILLVRRPVPTGKKLGWAIVEDPAPNRKVIRPLKNEKEARALIAERLAAYERMWDGCGACKPDYLN